MCFGMIPSKSLTVSWALVFFSHHQVVLFIPDHIGKTSDARAVLKDEVSLHHVCVVH